MTRPKKNIKTKNKKFKISNQQKLVLGSFLLFLGILLCIAFVSFFFTGETDQSIISEFTSRNAKANNWLSKSGAWLSYIFIYKGFGISSFIFSGLFFLSGVYVLLDINKSKLSRHWFWGSLIALWCAVFFSVIVSEKHIYGGTIGYEVAIFLKDYIGNIGTVFLLILGVIFYLAIRFDVSVDDIKRWLSQTNDVFGSSASQKEVFVGVDNALTEEAEAIKSNFNVAAEVDIETKTPKKETTPVVDTDKNSGLNFKVAQEEETIENDTKFAINDDAGQYEKTETQNLSDKLVADFGEFDPTLELGNFQFPTLELLKKYNSEGIKIDQEELESNKNKIVETLLNYKIGISSIEATIGPTITLYEIVPEAGVRISKIKNLEDDIALSLAALGIRIIAPMPGKGTIGIEVPNTNSTIVSMRSVIASQKFQKSTMALPVALGKTISNETLVVDLAKMPHLLMAGATGQGKSVGLNAVLTSLLYKKHPAEVKFVLVDPKKVELTLFNKIERHYLAKLPDSEEAIITDNTKVINTLNSLCIEMDNRYEMLKNAFCRNIAEYNAKFKARKLNPNDGHQFLPYIVLVVDEFADLIMTAGKEVELPIARLAQLARAIGIHLIIATQRPSVNVITGMIKANFPARIAFRVTSKIDSRTILDSSGADQLIGRGDMLYTQGNDLIRIQCAFVDTPEVEAITGFIGAQKAYPDAYLLPEYVGEDSGTSIDVDLSDRDKLFKDAAEVIVTAQQGSASLLQRKLKLGYNRAGRIIDQLEAAGIVGQFEGSKARQVLVSDLVALEQLLANEGLN